MRVVGSAPVGDAVETYMSHPWEQLGEARRSALGPDGKRRFTYQKDLAAEIGCAQQSVSAWETGKWPVPDEYVARFSEVTGMPVEVVEEINEKIRDKNRIEAQTLRLPREGVRARKAQSQEWLEAVGSDEEIGPLLRAVLLFLPRFAQIPGSTEVALDRDELLTLADVHESNLMDVWIDVLSSGYVSALGRNVYVLTRKKP